MIIKDINHLLANVACRIENEPETNEVYLTIVDRKGYPRLWIDNDMCGTEIIAETVENILLKNNPFLEKDWEIRFSGSNLTECINQYNNYINKL